MMHSDADLKPVAWSDS